MIDSMRISHLSSLMIEISVPSNLELVGYKIPIYTNKSSRTEVKNRTIQWLIMLIIIAMKEKPEFYFNKKCVFTLSLR